MTHIIVGDDVAKVFSDYEYRDVIKDIPGRRWVAEPPKHWTIPAPFVGELFDALSDAGSVVTVVNGDGSKWSRNSSPTGGWAAELLAAVGPQKVDQTVRALAKILHPDLPDGDANLMRQLNDARQDLRP